VSVYVDDWRQPARVGPVTGRWSHLLADTEPELHAFAERLGLKQAWYQRHRRHPALNHYDVTEPTRLEAIALGAVPLTWRETGRLIRKWRRAEDSPDG
jgi:hypothetical protein